MLSRREWEVNPAEQGSPGPRPSFTRLVPLLEASAQRTPYPRQGRPVLGLYAWCDAGEDVVVTVKGVLDRNHSGPTHVGGAPRLGWEMRAAACAAEGGGVYSRLHSESEQDGCSLAASDGVCRFGLPRDVHLLIELDRLGEAKR